MFFIDTIEQHGLPLLRLSDTVSGACACIDMQAGMNLVLLEYGHRSWIDWDTHRAATGATYAVPLLYPTPNRVKNNCFSFEEQQVSAVMHGCVRNRPFALIHQETSDTFARVTGMVDFRPFQPAYEQFPYDSSLSVTITLTEKSVQWAYTVQNDGDAALPYSFALHPFFKKHGAAFMRTPAYAVMEMDNAHYPTGRIIPIANTEKDLHNFIPTESIVLDDVFCVSNTPQAYVEFRDARVRLTLRASSEFKRLVVYTPANKDWFCLENQTSSTDCHNLHSAGLCEAANLQIVPPHNSKSGYIAFEFESF